MAQLSPAEEARRQLAQRQAKQLDQVINDIVRAVITVSSGKKAKVMGTDWSVGKPPSLRFIVVGYYGELSTSGVYKACITALEQRGYRAGVPKDRRLGTRRLLVY